MSQECLRNPLRPQPHTAPAGAQSAPGRTQRPQCPWKAHSGQRTAHSTRGSTVAAARSDRRSSPCAGGFTGAFAPMVRAWWSTSAVRQPSSSAARAVGCGSGPPVREYAARVPRPGCMPRPIPRRPCPASGPSRSLACRCSSAAPVADCPTLWKSACAAGGVPESRHIGMAA